MFALGQVFGVLFLDVDTASLGKDLLKLIIIDHLGSRVLEHLFVYASRLSLSLGVCLTTI